MIPRKKTPDLKLPTLDGGTFDLAGDGAERGTVVCFYRGLHCPICANYLKELEKHAKESKKEKQGLKKVDAAIKGLKQAEKDLKKLKD